MSLSLFGTRSLCARVCGLPRTLRPLCCRCLLPDHLRRAYHATCPPISGWAVEAYIYKSHAQEHVGIGYPAVMMLTVTRDGSTDNNSLSDSHSFFSCFWFDIYVCSKLRSNWHPKPLRSILRSAHHDASRLYMSGCDRRHAASTFAAVLLPQYGVSTSRSPVSRDRPVM